MLYTLLDVQCKIVFYILRDFSPKNTVSITNSKEMRSSILTQMRHNQILVLVDFIRILRTEARFGCERKLRYTIIELLLRCRNFSSYTCVSFYFVIIRCIQLDLPLIYFHNF